jgi:hypothetical protein
MLTRTRPTLHRPFARFGAATGLALALAVGAAAPAHAALEPPVQEGASAPTLLFVQDAKRGTFKPGPKPGQHWLTLYGVPKNVLWFENRPGNRKGTVSNRIALGGLFKPPVVPPNAAIDAWDPKSESDVVMGVKILSWKWFKQRNVMRYRVKELRNAPGSRKDRRVNSRLPREFGEAAVFIDDQFGRTECGTRLANKTMDYLTLDRNGTFAEPDGFSRNGYPRSSLAGGGGEYGFSHAFGGTWKGCYTRQTYKGARGTVTLGLDVPFFGSNSWACTTTGGYKCTGPLPGSDPYGDTVMVEYDITLK